MSRSLVIVIILAVVLVSLGLLWQWLAMSDTLTPGRLLHYTLAWRDSPWAIVVVMAIYAGASLVVFPMSILGMATGLVFGPLWGFVYAMAGTLAVSIITYWIGRRLGREVLLSHGGRRLNGLARRLAGRGFRTMAIINLLPLAPFPLTNMMAGAFHLRFRDYLAGSLVGIVPWVMGLTLLSSQVRELLTAENHVELLVSLGGVVLGVLLLIGLRRFASRRQRRSGDRS